jgi:uncharacterized Zn finger protein (UPF0148 family)
MYMVGMVVFGNFNIDFRRGKKMKLFIGKKECPRCHHIRNKFDFKWKKNVHEVCNSCRYEEINKKMMEKESQQRKPPKPLGYEDTKFQKQVYSVIEEAKLEAYPTPGVDEVLITGKYAKKQLLTRPSDYHCPRCKSILYNTKLDGNLYYCPTCNVQWDSRQFNLKDLIPR